MRRIRQGDAVVTTAPSYISDIRNYPAGTTGVVDTYLRDLDEFGYVTTEWTFVLLSDDTMLAYPVGQLRVIDASAIDAAKNRESA